MYKVSSDQEAEHVMKDHDMMQVPTRLLLLPCSAVPDSMTLLPLNENRSLTLGIAIELAHDPHCGPLFPPQTCVRFRYSLCDLVIWAFRSRGSSWEPRHVLWLNLPPSATLSLQHAKHSSTSFYSSPSATTSGSLANNIFVAISNR